METEIQQVSVYVVDGAKYQYREHYKKCGAKWCADRKQWFCLANDKQAVTKLMALRVSDPPIWHVVSLVPDKYDSDEIPQPKPTARII
jgi:hypothetical protein